MLATMDPFTWLPGSLQRLEDWHYAAAFFSALTLAILVYLAFKLRRDWRLAKAGAVAKGRIVGICEGEDSDYPVVEFADRLGRVFKFESELPQRGGTVVLGSGIQVLYDPANPRQARTTGRPMGRLGFYATLLFMASLTSWAAVSAMRDGLS
jgi:hypothetical protein